MYLKEETRLDDTIIDTTMRRCTTSSIIERKRKQNEISLKNFIINIYL